MNYNDELYHFGVKGMKWGVRKNTSVNKSNKKRKKSTLKTIAKKYKKRVEKTNKAIENVVDNYGSVGRLGVATANYTNYQGRKILKGVAAGIINQSANKFISSPGGSYAAKVGVDYARKAAITGLSISSNIDALKALYNTGYAYMYKGK